MLFEFGLVFDAKLNKIHFIEIKLISSRAREDQNSKRLVRRTNLKRRMRLLREIPPRFITGLLERSLISIVEKRH